MSIASYVVYRMILEPETLSVPSDAAEFGACVAAIDGLQHIRDVEDKYENLMENYIEWERTIHEHALRQMVSFDIDYDEHQVSRKLVARRLGNLLSSVRLYLDSLPKHVNTILSHDVVALTAVKKAPSVQYEARLSYRVLEAVRNYAQHSALPIHGLSTRASRTDVSAELKFAVFPIIDLDQLKADNNFKQSVLKELSTLEKIELKPMVREYIEGLSAVHDQFRTSSGPQRTAWTTQLREPVERFTKQFPGEPTIGLAVLPIDASGIKAGEEVYLAGPLLSYLDKMREKYVTMVNFSKRKVDF